jgi:hypothetical protein
MLRGGHFNADAHGHSLLTAPALWGRNIQRNHNDKSSKVKLLITTLMHFALCKEQQHIQKQDFFVIMV